MNSNKQNSLEGLEKTIEGLKIKYAGLFDEQIFKLAESFISQAINNLPLGLLSLSCLLAVIKKAEGYKKLRLFYKSIKGMQTLEELYFKPQETISKHPDYKGNEEEKRDGSLIDTEEKEEEFRKYCTEVFELLYQHKKEGIKTDIESDQNNIQEAKLALFIANGLKIGEISKLLTTLLTEKGIEGFDTEFLRILEGSQYNICEALIRCIKKRKVVPIPDRLYQLLNQETLSRALINAIKYSSVENLEEVKITVEILEALLKKVADPMLRNELGKTVLEKAILYKVDPAIIKTLLAHVTDPNILNPLLLKIIGSYSKEKVEITVEILKAFLAKEDININFQDGDGYTALHFAILYKAGSEIISVLLNGKNIDLSIKNQNGCTVLEQAILNEVDPAIIKTLLAPVADTKTLNRLLFNIISPYSKYKIEDTVAILKVFLAKPGIDVNIQDENKKTPLQKAIVNKLDLKIIKALLDHKGIKVNTQDENGDTALHLAVRNRNAAFIKLLLERGADPNVKNNDQQTPIELFIELFLERGADPNVKNNTLYPATDQEIKEILAELEGTFLARNTGAEVVLPVEGPITQLNLQIETKPDSGLQSAKEIFAQSVATSVAGGNTPTSNSDVKEAAGKTFAQPDTIGGDGDKAPSGSDTHSKANPNAGDKGGRALCTPTPVSQDPSKKNKSTSKIVACAMITLGIGCVIGGLFLAIKTNKFIDFSNLSKRKMIAFVSVAFVLPLLLVVTGIGVALSGPSTKVLSPQLGGKHQLQI